MVLVGPSSPSSNDKSWFLILGASETAKHGSRFPSILTSYLLNFLWQIIIPLRKKSFLLKKHGLCFHKVQDVSLSFKEITLLIY